MTRGYTVRVPRGIRPGRHQLVLRGGSDTSGNSDTLFADLLLSNGSGGSSSSGPTTLGGLVDAIHGLGRFDGVTGRIGSRRFDAFRDGALLVTGRAAVAVTVRR
jgi:hypothetical protein